MSWNVTREGVEGCVDVFDAFDVDATAVRDYLPVEVAEDTSMERVVAAALRASDASSPAVFVRRVIASADRGIDAPATYWNSALQVQLEAVFDAVGAEFEIVDATGERLDHGGTEEPFEISITDANGVTYETTAAYPDTPMGTDNYAAIVHAIERDLFSKTDFTWATLAGPDRRWRFALVREGDLADLQDRYGDQLEAFEGPVLAEQGAAAYVPTVGPGEVVVPDWAESRDGEDRDRAAVLEAAREPNEFDTDGVTAVDEILDGSSPDEIAARDDAPPASPATTDGGVMLAEAGFDQFAADLESVTPVTPEEPTPEEPTPGSVEEATDEDLAISIDFDPDADDTDGDGEDIDDLFEEIEQVAATMEADRKPASTGYEGAARAIADEFESAEITAETFDITLEDLQAFDWVDPDDLVTT